MGDLSRDETAVLWCLDDVWVTRPEIRSMPGDQHRNVPQGQTLTAVLRSLKRKGLVASRRSDVHNAYEWATTDEGEAWLEAHV